MAEFSDNAGDFDNDFASLKNLHLHNELLVPSSIVDSVGWGEQAQTLWEKV